LRSPKIHVIGILYPGTTASPAVQAMVEALAARGFRDGEGIRIDYRFSGSDGDVLASHAKELAELQVDVIVAFAGEAILAANRATNRIPIVSATGDGNFVEMGLIESWDQPGGNITGMNLNFLAAAATRVELLKDLVPKLNRLSVIFDPSFLTSPALLETMTRTAEPLGIELRPVPVRNREDIKPVVAAAHEEGANAVATAQGPLLHFHMITLVQETLALELPLAAGEPGAAEVGALLQVNVDVPKAARRSALFVDRILRGQSPSELPIERFGEMRRICNSRTARHLNLEFGSAVLQQGKQLEVLE
jgi:putative tryptophan/tyrosine transport system substrate-binding protein